MPLTESRSRQFDLLAFDWDGTLSDSTAAISRCIQLAVADVGGVVPSASQAAYVIGLGLVQALAHAAPDVPQQRYPELIERYRFHYQQRQDDICLFPGVVDMLTDLRLGQHWLVVATGKSRVGLDAALRSSELQGMFHSSRTAEETRSKPDPRMLLELMQEFDVPPQRLLMIGDTTHDLQLALNAGCASVAVSYGAHEPAGFAALEPLHVAHSVADLHAWLMEHA
jgi:phosphoglycolate phosphatase